jgi:hypothetical protein
MNERIQELVEQAGGHFGKDLEFAVVFGELDDFKKFAELIVRECLKIVEPTLDSGDEWCVTLKGTAQEIKEHFGVKE